MYIFTSIKMYVLFFFLMRDDARLVPGGRLGSCSLGGAARVWQAGGPREIPLGAPACNDARGDAQGLLARVALRARCGLLGWKGRTCGWASGVRGVTAGTTVGRALGGGMTVPRPGASPGGPKGMVSSPSFDIE